jgi:acetoacetyl-CoA reductase
VRILAWDVWTDASRWSPERAADSAAIALAFGREGAAVAVNYNASAAGAKEVVTELIDTDMSRAVMTPEYRAKRIGALPVRHLGQVEDVAYCAVFLAAEEANYLTGQVLQPNGGWVMA